jgi:hypothetical protein
MAKALCRSSVTKGRRPSKTIRPVLAALPRLYAGPWGLSATATRPPDHAGWTSFNESLGHALSFRNYRTTLSYEGEDCSGG